MYWYWFVFGMVLLLVELALPSFTALWFGLGAFIVGVILMLVPGLSLAMQLVIWAVMSCVMIFLWFKFVRPKSVDKTLAGLSREAVVGESGTVISLPIGDRRGVVRFAVPILGNSEWPFLTRDDTVNTVLQTGDRVRVVEVYGNQLLVEKS